MAAEIAKDTIDPVLRAELLVLMDDYGAELHVRMPVSLTAEQRQKRIETKIASHSAGQAQLEAYATAAGIDLTAQKTAGQQKRAAMQKQFGITPPAPAAAAPAPAAPAATPAPAVKAT